MQIVSDWWWLGLIPVGVGIFLIYMLWDDFRVWREAKDIRKGMSNWESFSFFLGDTILYLLLYLLVMYISVKNLIDEGIIIFK